MGAVITLQEQLVVTAVIDKLRFEGKSIDEMLDLPKRREQVKERIHEYYKVHNIEVADALIEEGVRGYFAGRMTFERPVVGKVAAVFAHLYVFRDRWVGKAAALVIFLTLAIGAATGASHWWTNQEVKAVVARYEKLSADKAQLAAQASEWRQRAISLEKQASSSGLPVGAGVAAQSNKDLGTVLEAVGKIRVGDQPSAPTDVRERSASLVEAELATVSVNAKKAYVGITWVEKLLSLNTDLDQLVATLHTYTGVASDSPAVASPVRDARSALLNPDATLDDVEEAVQRVRAILKDAHQIHDLNGRLATVKSQIAAIGQKSRGQSSELQAEIAAADNFAKAMDVPKLQDSVSYLEQLTAYAEPRLTFKVADRSGQKTGVERTYGGTGKSWYLIVEAFDDAGNRVAVPLMNVENGRRRFANTVGVRVSQETYETFKRQKRETGHVNVRDIGDKPANSIASTFSGTLGSHPDMIDQW
ncbi:DUF6384 family protein [Herbaspirillum sp. RV1423]|uniref:DUF6384 family protein n=1 Tax=Herbaspirillum sp. RV1423 TaxID=1443993 RepID=UPI0004BB5679|nr:DUF6384 family protein [Herbaspirillum sp. RV1423]